MKNDKSTEKVRKSEELKEIERVGKQERIKKESMRKAKTEREIGREINEQAKMKTTRVNDLGTIEIKRDIKT